MQTEMEAYNLWILSYLEIYNQWNVNADRNGRLQPLNVGIFRSLQP